MALPKITYLRGEGGLGRPLAGLDHVSGLVAYFTDGNLPAGFLTTDRVKRIFSIAEAVALGIVEGSAVHGVLWYHISEYFKAQPKGELYVGLYDSVATDLTVIETVQNFAEGRIRQIGVFSVSVYAPADVDILQTSADTLETENRPLSVFFAADISGVADLSTLADLRAKTAERVSVVIGEDGDAVGAALAVSSTKSVTALGAFLGTESLAKVNENAGWIGKFNIVKDSEFDVAGMANGQINKDLAASLLDTLNDQGYVFLRKHEGRDGTFFSDAPTSIAVSSDFAYVENVRTMDKAVRGTRVALLPNLNGPVIVNADGTLPEETIAKYTNDADTALEQMQIDGEISARSVVVNPAQNVLATSKVEITIKIVPVGVAREIEVKIGFAVSVEA